MTPGSVPPSTGAPVTPVGLDESGVGIQPDDSVHDPSSRWERRFCIAIFVVAAVVGAVLVGAGQPLPPVGPLVLLAVLVALSVNLGALFPTEFSATADIAILFAAVVGFAADAPLLGAFMVGLLMGPLDWLHWKQRVFYRMAYNAGSQSLCVLLAAVVFRALASTVDDVVVVLAAAAASAVVWIVGDIALVTLILVRRGGTSTVAAARHVVVLNGLSVPFALVGAMAGLLARNTGWWAAALVLVPLPFMPDLVLVRARRIPMRRVLVRLRLPALALTLAACGILAGDADRAALVTLAVVSVALGTEVRPDAGTLVAPAVATVVIAAAVVVDGRDAFLGAALVAVGGVGAAALSRRHVNWSIGGRALVLGVVAALTSAGVYEAVARDRAPSTRVVVGALLAGLAFEGVVVALGARQRRAAFGRAVCSVPLLAVASALAVAWVVLGTESGAAMFAASLVVAMGLVAWWGAPPWSSRWLAHVGGRIGGRRVVLGATAVVATGTALVAVVLTGAGHARDALVLCALAAAQADVAMAGVAVRQWRFAPRRRAFDTALLAVAVGGLAVGYPWLGLDGRGWSVVLLVALLALVIAVAWPLGAHADRAATRAGPSSRDGQRMPERRNASA